MYCLYPSNLPCVPLPTSSPRSSTHLSGTSTWTSHRHSPLACPEAPGLPQTRSFRVFPSKKRAPLFPRCLDQSLIPCFISQPHPIQPQVLSIPESRDSLLPPLPPLVSETLLCPTWVVAALPPLPPPPRAPPQTSSVFTFQSVASHGTFQLSTICHGSHHTQKQIPTPPCGLKSSGTPAFDSLSPSAPLPPTPAEGSSHFALGLLLGHAQLLPVSGPGHLLSCPLEGCPPAPHLLGLASFLAPGLPSPWHTAAAHCKPTGDGGREQGWRDRAGCRLEERYVTTRWCCGHMSGL